MAVASHELTHLNLRRILITTDAVGGIWQYSLQLAAELSRAGCSILLAVLGPSPSEQQRREAQRISRLLLVEHDGALEWMPNPWADVDSAGKWLLDLNRQFDPDLVHVNGFAHSALAWQRPVVCVAHSCVYSWWRAVHECSPSMGWAEYYSRVQRGLQSASAIVTPTATMANAIAVEYGIRSSEICVVSNFSEEPTSKLIEKRRYAMAAGRFWDKSKNFAVLDDLVKSAAWPVHLAGNGSDSFFVNGNSIGVGVLGHKEMNAEMDGCSIFLHPAVYEPFGLVVCEAAHRSCCLLLADIPSLRELWDGAAIFVNPRDRQLWRERFWELTSDADAVRKWGAQAQKRAGRFTREAFLAGYGRVYLEVMEQAGAKRTTVA